jgi:hypothetical protein
MNNEQNLFGNTDSSSIPLLAYVIKSSKETNFPDFQIYQTCLPHEDNNQTALAVHLPNIENFSQTLNTLITGFLRYWHEAMGNEADKYCGFRHAFWYKRDLLLWFQRAYHVKWFVGYNPRSDDAYDTPYDYDHILPQAHIVGQGSRNNVYNDNKENQFYHGRFVYINSIGNYRTWPYWANRSDQDKCHTIKLWLVVNNDPRAKENAQALGLNTNIDFLKASFIDTNDLNLWLGAKGSPKDWSKNRRTNWQEAVEKRVIYLYTTLFNAFEFHKWTENNQ